MVLKIHNTLSGTKEPFAPVDKQHVRVYACGPTVYNFAHIGNARMAVANDLLIKVLRTQYNKVTYVSNITDIDDKIIDAAHELNEPIQNLTTKYTKIYNEDMAYLNVSLPDVQPRATDHIDEMIVIITKLIKNNNAYEKEGHVLFHVPSFSKYGVLSKRNRDEQIAGSRVEVAPFKKDPADFILWKPSPDPLPGWDSPWGFGRPGWHLECSAMSEKTLGLPFDIHSGGMDLVFPHHENEIAQTCSLNKTDEPKSFARFWFHNGFVNVEGEKMSKSIGNIRLVHDLKKQFSGEVLRLTLLSAHYRQPLNWTKEIIDQNSKMLDRFYRTLKDLQSVEVSSDSLSDEIMESLLDDLNTPKVLAQLNTLSNKLSSANNDEKMIIKNNLIAAGRILGIMLEDPDLWLGYNQSLNPQKEEIEGLINQRNEARRHKDFKLADEIRDKLKLKGIEIEDTKNGTIWRKDS
ncbi:MAG: cysteine--tRNA ligase [Pelagibacteraceae bacterium]|nr:cysteine--tRNA ligase [Pelagibacteraceae bacterium]